MVPAAAAAALAAVMVAGMRNAGRIPPRCFRRRFRRWPQFIMFCLTDPKDSALVSCYILPLARPRARSRPRPRPRRGGGDGGGLGLDVRVEVRPSPFFVHRGHCIGMGDISNTPASSTLLSIFIQHIQPLP